ncbi:MAG: type I methionyl aminopeptidase [Oligoflexia bacterium]|nr:type I methionyl aminopeptidase [Oligoflexia bacterium]
MVTIKSEREIEKMRKAGKAAAECLTEMMKLVKAGVTPLEIDRACHEWTVSRGYIPAPLNYHGFPKSICISVNDVVCHGIPDKRAFKEGDIVNLDVTPIVEGFHGDTNATVCVGKVKPEVRKLVDATLVCLWEGIRQVKPGATLGDIGYAIQKYAEGAGYSVVLEYCGHGIGRGFHEDPSVSHVGRPGQGMKLREGMTFTIEPMINLGKRHVYVEDDDWTVRTKDGSVSAQFEHTVLVTPDGVEVLTLRKGETPVFPA